MCGTGRIGLPLVQEGVDYTGVDYSQKLLDRFREKLDSLRLNAKLVYADVRHLDMTESFDLVFIGFHSLSEILENRDKARLFEWIRTHMTPSGHFTFSLHHAAVRESMFDGERSTPRVFDLDDRHRLEFSHQFQPPSPAQIVTGKQFYRIKDPEGRIIDERELAVQFHLVHREKIEALLSGAGFTIRQLCGDYDRSPFVHSSPYLIYRCTG